MSCYGFSFVPNSSVIRTLLLPQLLLLLLIVVNCCCAQRTPPRCERITAPMCQRLGYNTTLMPNFMGHQDQRQASLGLQQLDPLVSHDCSPHLRLFVCSVFVPLCSEHVPGAVPACRGLCESVKRSCLSALTEAGLSWPAELECSRFPEPPALCMQQPNNEHNPDHPTEQHHIGSVPGDSVQDIVVLDTSGVNFCPTGTVSSGDVCLKTCNANIDYNIVEKRIVEMWIGIWSSLCVITTAFTTLTFLTQPRRFRWPARPVFYLTICGLIRASLFLLRFSMGSFTCAGELTLSKPTDSFLCTIVGVMLVYLDVTMCAWWLVLTAVWFLSAAREWSTEALEKASSRFHAAVWSISSVPVFIVLVNGSIETDELTQLCTVPYRTSLLVSALPQIILVLCGGSLAVGTGIALIRVRKTLILAGRSPSKLERLMWRLGILLLSIFMCLLMENFGVFLDKFSYMLLHICMPSLAAISATTWICSIKTFKTWNKLLNKTAPSKFRATPIVKV